jgi:hypothetical protein
MSGWSRGHTVLVRWERGREAWQVQGDLVARVQSRTRAPVMSV